MADKFKPLNYNPRFVYDANYWNIVAQDAYHFFWNSFMWGLTGKFPFSPRRIIVYCGNPECFSLIAYYPDQRPTTCNKCGKEIESIIQLTPVMNFDDLKRRIENR